MDDPPTTDARTLALAEERGRLRLLRAVVDLTTAILQQGRVSPGEADALVAASRRRILDLFPDKEGTYDLILAPRFARLIHEFVVTPSARRVLPFRR